MLSNAERAKNHTKLLSPCLFAPLFENFKRKPDSGSTIWTQKYVTFQCFLLIRGCLKSVGFLKSTTQSNSDAYSDRNTYSLLRNIMHHNI
jgi:hypothetical protein